MLARGAASTKRKRSGGEDSRSSPAWAPAPGDRVEAEFVERVSGDDARFWSQGTVKRVSAAGAVTVRFDADGNVETYSAGEVATELRPATEAGGSGARKFTRLVDQFSRDGLCQLKHGLTKEQVRMCRREVYKMFGESMEVIRRLDLQDDLARGFSTFKLRHTGRYDMEIKDFEKPSFSFLREKAPWLPLVHAILGDDCVLNHTGVMLSMPGSETQPWHSDGPHLSSKKHLPVHCINVFVPLVNLTADNGGTEMIPGTHVLGRYDDKSRPLLTPLAPSGSCILFDFRLRHRGLGNKSRKPRPLMYITYCVPSFRDTANFSRRRYLTLPSLADLPTPRGGVRGREGSGSEWDALFESDSDDDDNAAAAAAGPQETREERVAKRLRAARAKHRDLAGGGFRRNGITFYVGAPVLALDKQHGWFAAKVTALKLDADPPTAKVHFNGWHKRFDFSVPVDSDRLKPCPVELLAAGVKDAVEPKAKGLVTKAVAAVART